MHSRCTRNSLSNSCRWQLCHPVPSRSSQSLPLLTPYACVRALRLIHANEHGIAQDRRDGPFSAVSHVTPCIRHTDVLIFHDKVCLLSSRPAHVSTFSKPRAFNCGRSVADCCVGWCVLLQLLLLLLQQPQRRHERIECERHLDASSDLAPLPCESGRSGTVFNVPAGGRALVCHVKKNVKYHCGVIRQFARD